MNCYELYLPPLDKYHSRFKKGDEPYFSGRKMIFTTEEKRQNSLNALKIGRQKGLKRPKKNKPCVLINNGAPLFFDSFDQASKYLQCSPSNISMCISGKKQKTVKGHLCYLQDCDSWKDKLNENFKKWF